MSELCEIVEAVGEAMASCDVEQITVAANSAPATTLAVVGVALTLTAAAAAVTTADPSSYALLTAVGTATTTATASTSLTEVSTSAAEASTVAFVAIPVTATSEALGVTSVMIDRPPPVLTATGVATTTATPFQTITQVEESNAEAVATATVYYEPVVTATGAGTTTASWLVQSYVTSTSVALATATASPSNVPTLPILENIGVGTTSVTMRIEWVVVGESTAQATSSVVLKNPGRVAWLMNTETAAVSWYDNFDFESIAQVNGVTFAVGPGGIYELTGDSDNGDTIDASLRSGFMDFGTQQQKRIEAFYFGYTSPGVLRTLVSTKDSGHSPSAFDMLPRVATAPRNNRIEPGKGLVGTYWQVELYNVAGAPFTVYDASVDLAISNRKL
jgi:hypothetical protein